jgi:hypothetical protein
MIIAGVRSPDLGEVARQLRARMAQAEEVGEPRSGDHPTGRGQTDGEASTEYPKVKDDGAAN